MLGWINEGQVSLSEVNSVKIAQLQVSGVFTLLGENTQREMEHTT